MKILEDRARQEYVPHCLGGPPTVAVPVWYIQHPTLVEVVSEPYLSCAHLYDDCAECPVETPMHLQDLSGRGRYQLIHCRPCGLVCQSCSHCVFIASRILDSTAVRRSLCWTGRGAVAAVMASPILPRCPWDCRHPVTSFAALSALSFPSMPLCEGIHWKLIVSLLVRALLIAASTISKTYCPNCLPGFWIARSAA